ncbi:hypothetical protein HER10_EVM0009933 [Colletotrichum scovillei]|nr:uncharacterized protein HER10_EVM0009933 [Colletotrichum scovillei]KAF4784581.1 hypothetical protein HER10_EVM0009933 [Colletotrichum scovillei]
MAKVGIVDDLVKAGHINYEGIQFRQSYARGGEVLGSLKMSQVPKGTVKYNYAGIHLGQHLVAKIILEHCQKQQSFRILWKHRFVGANQTNNSKPVEVLAVGPSGEVAFTCDYLIGCDGASSAVRRSLCIPFEGFTWTDFRFVASNVNYNFEKYGFATANMIVDEEDWAVIARTGPGDEPWRVAFGVPADIVDSDIIKQLHEKYERLLPGPRPLEYDLVNANPYWAHQRCAKTFHNERIVLCGDAAHSNNPIGGLGLTTGFLDSAALGNCLLRILILEEEAGPLLSRYGEVRKATWQEFTNKASTDFKLRLHSDDPEVVAEREAFIYALNNDPDVHKKAASSMNENIQDMFEGPLML